MQIDEFVSPKAMITPTVVGGAATVISASLFVNFRVQPKVSLLVLSFLLATVVAYSKEFKSPKVPRMVKVVLYLINSLLIFANATGTNAVLANRVQIASLIVPTVYAQEKAPAIKQSRPAFYDFTKATQDPLAEVGQPNNVPLVSYESQRINKGAVKDKLTDAGILVPDYKVRIRVPVTNQRVKSITYHFPKEFGIPPVTKAPGETVDLEAWKSFTVRADLLMENGETMKVFQSVDPSVDPSKEKK